MQSADGGLVEFEECIDIYDEADAAVPHDRANSERAVPLGLLAEAFDHDLLFGPPSLALLGARFFSVGWVGGILEVDPEFVQFIAQRADADL